MVDPELEDTATRSETSPAGPAKPCNRGVRIRPGDCLGRYTVRALLGRGGMGEVFEAHDPELDRLVALKVLRPELVESSARAHARFVREAQAIRDPRRARPERARAREQLLDPGRGRPAGR